MNLEKIERITGKQQGREKINLPREELLLRAARLDAWKEEVLQAERNVYTLNEINVNGGKRPHDGEESLIAILLKYRILPKDDFQRMLRGEPYTGPGMGLEIDPEAQEIRLKRTKPPRKSKDHLQHHILEDCDMSMPIVEAKPGGPKVFKTDKAHGRKVRAEKQRKAAARAQLKAADFNKMPPGLAMKAMAEAMGIYDEASIPRGKPNQVWKSIPPQAQGNK